MEDIITPNQFELGYLPRTEPGSLESTLASVDIARCPGAPDRAGDQRGTARPPEGAIEMLAVDDDGTRILQTPYLPFRANGSGDVTSAQFTAHYRTSKWKRRYDDLGELGLVDRASVPGRSPTQLAPALMAQIQSMGRKQKMTARQIRRELRWGQEGVCLPLRESP